MQLASFCNGQGNNIVYGLRNYGLMYEFVRINCNNDNLTVLDTLPFNYYSYSTSSSLDLQQQKYYYCQSQKLEVIDINTGNSDTIFDFSSINSSHFIHAIYNPADSMIYGIRHNWATFDKVFAKFNPVTGVLTDIASLPSGNNFTTGAGCKSAIDPYNGLYYLQSRDLACIRISDGQLLYVKPLITPTNEYIDHMAFSCHQGSLFGLSSNHHTVEQHFSVIDTTNGNTTHRNASPLSVPFYKQYLSGSCIDNQTDIFYYSTAMGVLIGIDINTGQVVYNHDFGPYYQFLFLESGAAANCLVAGISEHQNNGRIEVYPNPGTGIFTFHLNEKFEKGSLEIFDENGKTVYLINDLTGPTITTNISHLSDGIYFYKVITGESVLRGKLVKATR